MVEFSAVILKFGEQGEKSGWSYIEVPAALAHEIKPGNRRSFRVKGLLDAKRINGIALLPMGEGDFILPLNGKIRKEIGKGAGATLHVLLEVDNEFSIVPPAELIDCLEDDQEAFDFFNSLPKSHRDYFIKWIESAKTIETRTKRIANTVNAMVLRHNYNQMMRWLKNNRD